MTNMRYEHLAVLIIQLGSIDCKQCIAMVMRKIQPPPSWSLWRLHVWLGAAGQKMTVEKKMNILAGDCGKKKLNNKIDRRWEKQRPVQKAPSPHYFLGINTLGGRFGTLRFLWHNKIVSDHQNGIFWFWKLVQKNLLKISFRVIPVFPILVKMYIRQMANLKV